MKKALGIATSVVASVTVMTLSASPASATVHEIVGQWCADRGELFPPGLSGGSSGDNLAQPLVATGVASVGPYAGGGILITLDFSHPAIKLAPTGTIEQIGPGTFITGYELDGAFMNCQNLRS